MGNYILYKFYNIVYGDYGLVNVQDEIVEEFSIDNLTLDFLQEKFNNKYFKDKTNDYYILVEKQRNNINLLCSISPYEQEDNSEKVIIFPLEGDSKIREILSWFNFN